MVSLDPVIEKIFAEAQQAGASDIHLEPLENGLSIRLRVEGRMIEGPILGPALKESLPAKLKVMARLDPNQTQRPQDGALHLQSIHARLSALPVAGGQSLVLRLFGQAQALERLAGLGLTQAQIDDVGKILGQQGLFIIAGPTGSGKTTSFYATLRQLDPQKQKIITVEDPVEQRLPGVCQVPVRGELTFHTALRSVLRQSPDVIGVGELRDAESAQMALQAALTGHLVVATLHASSAAEVPVRLLDLGLDPSILAEVLKGMMAQRILFRRDAKGIHQAHGIFEVAAMNAQLKALIRQRATVAQLAQLLMEQGCTTLRQRAQELVDAGQLPEASFWGEFPPEAV